MKSKLIKNSFLLVISTLFLASCGEENISSSSSSSSDSSKEYVSLATALANTKDSYELGYVTSSGAYYPFSIYSSDFYYYSPYEGGYLVPENDNNYLHSFALTSIQDDSDEYNYSMNVYGRNAFAENYQTYFDANFIEILEKYTDDFTKISANTYASSEYTIASDLRDYFMVKSFGYCNYFEIVIGEDGRIKNFIPYEKSVTYDYSSQYAEFEFRTFEKSSYSPYVAWVKGGSKFQERIYDLKCTDEKDDQIYALYDNEQIEISGIVSSFDYDGNYYISAEDSSLGDVAIKVKPQDKSNIPAIKDEVTISGSIASDEDVAYIKNGAFKKTGTALYYPYFDEEQIVDAYGGGYYAYYYFRADPTYNDCVYSTYAYIYAMPEAVSENEDTYIDLVFPNISGSMSLKGYRSQIVLPKNAPLEKRQEVFNQLKEMGLRGESDAKEVSLEKFIIKFDESYQYKIRLLYGSESSVSKRLTAQEKVEKQFGISSFPFPTGDNTQCYSFGGGTGLSLESSYGKEVEDPRKGIYFYNYSVSSEDMTSFISSIENIGFSLYNGYKDYGGLKHLIYKNSENVVIDYYLVDGYMGNTGSSLYLWMYQGDVIYYQTIQEKLEEEVPFFNADDFVTLDELDSSFSFYSMDNYAGNSFAEGKELACVTMDVNDDTSFTELISAYRNEKGYSRYRTSDNKIYSYSTRSSMHYVFYKAIEGGDEYIFVDLAQYPTSDYTFYGAGEFTNRIEILIYKGKEPLSTQYTASLDGFASAINEEYGANLKITLPDNCKVETYYEAKNSHEFVYYGYCYNMDSFIYADDLTSVYNSIVSSLAASGYELSTTSEKGNVCYGKTCTNENGQEQVSYISIIKGSSYIRILNSILGESF